MNEVIYEIVNMYLRVYQWGTLVAIPSLEGEEVPSYKRGLVVYNSGCGHRNILLYGLLKAIEQMTPYMREAFESLPSRGGNKLALAREVVALSKELTEKTFPDAGKAKKDFLSLQREKVLAASEKEAERTFIYLLQCRKALKKGHHFGMEKQEFLPKELLIGVRLDQLKYRWGEKEIDELYSLGGVDILSDKVVGEDIPLIPSEEEVFLLTVEERNRLAEERGWCHFRHGDEQPVWWRGHLVHVSDRPRNQDGWSHDRPFLSVGKELFVVEARKPYNKKLTEEEWNLLLSELELKYYELQYFSPLQRGEGWVDTTGNADQLNQLLQQEEENDSFHLLYEEMEQCLERKASSRRSTKCYNKERRRANR